MSSPEPGDVLEDIRDSAEDAAIVKPKKRRGKEPIVPGMLDCPHCKYIGTTKTGLLNHIRKHLLEVVYTCSLCKDKFDSNAKLLKHKIIHKDEKRSFLCRKCNMAFTENYYWLQHEIDHYSNYKCPECTKYFKEKKVARRHLDTHFDLSLKCDMCDEIFKSEKKLKEHVNLHEKIFECCECGRVFKNNNLLQYHMMSHTGLKPHQCLYCGQGFCTITARNIHTRKHTGEMPYKCDVCQRKFTQQPDFARHKCTGTEKREKIECTVCNKKLFKWSLTGHMRLHTNDRKYQCPDCKEAYVSNASLRLHILYKHSNEFPVKCTQEGCDEVFKVHKELNRHLFKVHKLDVPRY